MTHPIIHILFPTPTQSWLNFLGHWRHWRLIGSGPGVSAHSVATLIGSSQSLTAVGQLGSLEATVRVEVVHQFDIFITNTFHFSLTATREAYTN